MPTTEGLAGSSLPDDDALVLAEDSCIVEVLDDRVLVTVCNADDEPHRVAFYLQDLAASFHGLWNKGNDDATLRFIAADDPELTQARLALVQSEDGKWRVEFDEDWAREPANQSTGEASEAHSDEAPEAVTRA